MSYSLRFGAIIADCFCGNRFSFDLGSYCGPQRNAFIEKIM